MTFEQLGVAPALLKAIEELGFERPMPIQELVIPHLLTADRDVIALAQTGTGKTAAFGLPLLQRIDATLLAPQALILAPTRELCLQIGSDLTDFAKYLPEISVLPVYGGSSIRSQISALERGVQVVVATPGRLLDLIRREKVDLDAVRTVILDEADEMLNMGFVDDIDEVLSHVPQERKMMLFSATMPKPIEKLARKYMHEPEEYVVGTRNEGAASVRHLYYLVSAKDKYTALKRLADFNPHIYGIVFCRTKRETQEVADNLIADGYNADALHGDLSQDQRDWVMKKFRDRNLQLLVATDVAARGLDVSDLTHVINYGLPDDIDVYTHRSGRTGRAGKTGISIAIIHTREKGKIRRIEKQIGKQFERSSVPSPKSIIEKQLYNLADRIERTEVNEEEINRYIPGVMKKLGWLSGEDLLKRVLSMEFNRLLDYYKDARKIDIEEADKPARGERGDKRGDRKAARTDADKDRREAERGYERLYINLGKADGFFAPDLIKMINRNVEGRRVSIGAIDLLTGYSLFDVEKGAADKVVSCLRGTEFYGKRVYTEIAKRDKDYSADGDQRERATPPSRFEREREQRRARTEAKRKRATRTDDWERDSRRPPRKPRSHYDDKKKR